MSYYDDFNNDNKGGGDDNNNGYNGGNNDDNGQSDLFKFPVYSGGAPRKPDNEYYNTLLKSNKNYKILAIVLAVVVFLCCIATVLVTTLTASYFSRNRSTETTNNINELARVVSGNTINSVVEVRSVSGGESSRGSGFIINSSLGSAYIMTNKHVIENSISVASNSFIVSGRVSVRMNGATDFINATIEKISTDLDFAILRVTSINAVTYPAVTFGNSDNLSYGDFVLASGNALGYGISVTQGIVSVPKTTILDNNVNVTVVQIDAAINPGNSGGPLFNKDCKVVGINTYKKTTSSTGQTVEGMGYAIPSNLVIQFINGCNLGFSVQAE